MKKNIMLLICSCTILQLQAQRCISLKDVNTVARNYYDAIQLICSDPWGDGYIKGRLGISAAFGNDMNGLQKDGEMKVPNDIDAWLDNPYTDLRAANYVATLSRSAHEYGITFRYNIKKCEYLYGAEMAKGESLPQFARVIVEKQLQSPQLANILIIDTLFVNTETRGISLISNKYRTERHANTTRSIEEMIAEASNLYAEKQYDEAFRLFSKILEKDPHNSTASYQLGVMCAKGQGCKQYPRKVRDYMAEFYWQKSPKGRDVLVNTTYHSTTPFAFSFTRAEYSYEAKWFSGSEPHPFTHNRMPVLDRKSMKFGYISQDGNLPIKNQYIFALPFFDNGLALVVTETQFLLIDTVGRTKEVLQDYSGEDLFTRSIFRRHILVRNKTGKMGCLDRKTGETLVPFEYDGLMFKEPQSADQFLYFIAEKKGKIGIFIPWAGEFIPCKYENFIDLDYLHTRDHLYFLFDYDKEEYKYLSQKYTHEPPVAELKKIGILYTIVSEPTPSHIHIEARLLSAPDGRYPQE